MEGGEMVKLTIGMKYKTTFSGNQRVILVGISNDGTISVKWRNKLYCASIAQLIDV